MGVHIHVSTQLIASAAQPDDVQLPTCARNVVRSWLQRGAGTNARRKRHVTRLTRESQLYGGAELLEAYCTRCV